MDIMKEALRAFDCYVGSYPFHSASPFSREIFLEAFMGGATTMAREIESILTQSLPDTEYITELSALRKNKKGYIKCVIKRAKGDE